MRAMVLRRPAPAEEKPLQLSRVPVPSPGPGEVLIHVHACGVCHTDLHTVEGELSLPRLPLVPGHEIVGTVVAVGPAAAAGAGTGAAARATEPAAAPAAPLQVGDRVGVPWLHWACGQCDYCRNGQENLCPSARFTGLQADGGYAEYCIAPVDFVVPIPERFGDLEAAPLLCAGIIGYRSLRLSGIRPGGRLGLFGFGASAHLALQVARFWGCSVYVFTRSEAHRRLALELGATWAGPADEPAGLDPGPGQGAGPAGAGPEGAGLDAAVTFAPVGSLIPAALRRLRPGGTLAVNAIHLDGLPAMPYGLLYQERVLRSVTNSTRQDAREFMQIAGQIPLRVEAAPYPLEDANQALLDMKKGRIRGAAAVLQIVARH
ncbi:MAG: zinc-dependent alcohol dehydrogenase family protein [Firmicutes bacterium]|nr:zinc-dependent alcohol dehydrogenase family protein [Bacillota bacterium]